MEAFVDICVLRSQGWQNKSEWQIRSPAKHTDTVADPGGATGVPPPLKLDQLCVCFFIRMLGNKAQSQIARESIKTTRELPGPLSGPWTPAEREFGPALVMFLRAHNLLPPPPPPKWKSWIRSCRQDSIGLKDFFFFFRNYSFKSADFFQILLNIL